MLATALTPKEVRMPYFDHGTAHIYFEDEGDGAPVLLMHGSGRSMHEVRCRPGGARRHSSGIVADTPGSRPIGS